MKDSVYLEADIVLEEETAALREAASSVITLPADGDKQPDLQYFSAIFVSSGQNLNNAFFMPSELIKAEGSIINKALDIEHKEEDIIGHIYERAFSDKEGNPLDVGELASLETAALDGKDIHVHIAGIIYKKRFPEVAEEVAEGKWKVSMETYFRDYDVKIGDLVISRNEAESLGIASNDDSFFGKVASVIKEGKEIAKGTVVRVLRDLVFSGCGIVEKPANPPSVIFETAGDVVLSYSSESDSEVPEEASQTSDEETSDLDSNIGICVSYKKRIIDSTIADQDSQVVHENWCTFQDNTCTSFSRDTTDPDCLRRQVKAVATEYALKLMEERDKKSNIDELTNGLKAALSEAVKIMIVKEG